MTVRRKLSAVEQLPKKKSMQSMEFLKIDGRDSNHPQ